MRHSDARSAAGGGDTITLGAIAVNGAVDLAGGGDTLILGDFNNTVTVANTETIAGGTGTTPSHSAPRSPLACTVDLGTGDNKLALANVANTGAVSNVKPSPAAPATTPSPSPPRITNGSVDLGGGSDTLTFGNCANTVTVANIETITGGIRRRHRHPRHRADHGARSISAPAATS